MAITQHHRFQTFTLQKAGLSLLFSLFLIPCLETTTSASELNWLEEVSAIGLQAEQRGDWAEAYRCYYEAYRRDRTNSETKQGYQRCLRRVNLQQRHKDSIYRQILGRLKPSEACEIYKEVLSLLGTYYVDQSRTNLNTLFHEGIQEIGFALEDQNFRMDYLPNPTDDLINAFKLRLGEWKSRKIQSQADAAEEVANIIRVAQEMGLGNRKQLATVLTLEFAFGACNALDEYSFFLTPSYPIDPIISRSKQASTGIEISFANGRLEITRVYPHSPADAVGLNPHDRILKIDGQPVTNGSLSLLVDRLRGESGSFVEMEVQQFGQLDSHLVRIERRILVAPTIDYRILQETMDPELIGYLKITTFQETTLQEVKDALADLQTSGIKALVLDLRGNPGGLFRSAVQICELFVESGIVVTGRSPIKGYQGPIKAGSTNPFQLPMVVLIDKETASSSEVLAGALKERLQTRLMGQVSYGKGSIQSVLPLVKSTTGIRMSAGIRLTVAHLFSPVREEPYTGRGITPHDLIEAEGDSLLEPARATLLQMIRGMMMIR